MFAAPVPAETKKNLQRGHRVADVAELDNLVIPRPAALYYLLATKPLTVGQAMDIADAVPAHWIPEILITMGIAATDEYRAGKTPRQLLRHLTIMSRLLDRLVFEVEGVPEKRSAPL